MYLLPGPWYRIKREAASEDEYDRHTALSRACGSLEQALVACGVRGERGRLPPRIRRSPAKSDQEWPSESDLLAAVNARNCAIHEMDVPKRRECITHVGTFYKAWCALRRNFVTKERAADLASRLLKSDFFHEIFLFGSLAHDQDDPWDIDLLLSDLGEISSLATGYGRGDSEISVAGVLKQFSLLTEAEHAAVACGWLDFVAIDSRRFDTKSYREWIVRLQPDPLFFLNIAVHLLVYDPNGRQWTKSPSTVFKRLASLRLELEKEGILSDYAEMRQHDKHRSNIMAHRENSRVVEEELEKEGRRSGKW